MRSHDAAEVKARCRQAIPALLAAHGLPAPQRIVQDEFGWVNPCFFVDDALVVRFNARDPHLPKFQREVRSFELLADHDLPVPEVVAFDQSHAHTPWDALVTRLLPGGNLESIWPTLDAEAREHAAFEAGVLLARIHAIPVEGFGEIAAPSREASWLTAVTHLRDGHIAECRRTGVLDETDFAQVVAAFDEAGDILATVTVPSLVHRDYHLGNLLLDGDSITGVVDFEWAIHGDPEMDLCLLAEVATICPGSREPFLAGYTSVRPLTQYARRKVALYRCLRNLELCAVTIEHYDGEDLAESVAVTRKQIAGLSATATG